MAWTKLDDRFWSHPKIQGLSPAAFRLYVMSLNWSVSHLTDGEIPEGVVAMFVSRSRRVAVAELTRNGLWTETRNGVYQIHDFAEYQPTKAQVEKERSQTRERVSAWRRRQTEGDVTPLQDEGNAVTNAARNSPRNDAPTRPDPSKSPTGTRDEVWDALIEEIYGDDPPTLTKTERGRLNAAVRDLKAVGATADDVRSRSAAYRRAWPDVEFTATGLVANWNRFAAGADLACPHRWPSGKTAVSVIDADPPFRRCDVCYATIEEEA